MRTRTGVRVSWPRRPVKVNTVNIAVTEAPKQVDDAMICEAQWW